MNLWHLITSEYPPKLGGVSDYSRLLGEALALSGEEVHVWCPPALGEQPSFPGVTIHPTLGRFGPSALWKTGRQLDRFHGPRRLFVQWVPHGYGWRSLNLAFCCWVYCRALRGDQVELMVHEPFLRFTGSIKQYIAAALHRLMTGLLCRSARRIWLSTPAWEPALRPYTPRGVPTQWLPVFSTVSTNSDPTAVSAVRQRYAPEGPLVGRFGKWSPGVNHLLGETVPLFLQRLPAASFLLIGSGSERTRDRILSKNETLRGRVHATGDVPLEEVPNLLTACDVLMQPLPEGLTTRNTSVLAGLANGRPVVSTSSPLTEALWSESRAVVLVRPDPTELADATVQLLGRPGELYRLGQAGKELYANRFDLKHTLKALLPVHIELCHRNDNRGVERAIASHIRLKE